MLGGLMSIAFSDFKATENCYNLAAVAFKRVPSTFVESRYTYLSEALLAPWFKPLQDNLKASIKRFGKDIMVVETAYPWHPNCDDPTKLLHKKERRPLVSGLPASKGGQKAFLEQIIKAAREAVHTACAT